MMTAMVLRLSGLREITRRCGRALRSRNFSSLCPALRRRSSLAFVQVLVTRLEGRHRPGRDALVAIDGMAVSLPSTTRHRCSRINHRAVGGGVIWAFAVDAARGLSPVRVLKVIQGAWNDSCRMKDVALEPRGPVYLMDRGFFSVVLIERWLGEGVRFIVRTRRDAVHRVERELSPARRWGDGRIELDAVARLGNDQAKAHPVARLIRAVIGEQVLLLATSELDWSAERVLAAYKKRERIERFHRVLKESIGLAHLYSFAWTGMAFLLHVALLLAMLLVLGATDAAGKEVVDVLRQALTALRRALGLGGLWKRNIVVYRRGQSPHANR